MAYISELNVGETTHWKNDRNLYRQLVKITKYFPAQRKTAKRTTGRYLFVNRNDNIKRKLATGSVQYVTLTLFLQGLFRVPHDRFLPLQGQPPPFAKEGDKNKVSNQFRT